MLESLGVRRLTYVRRCLLFWNSLSFLTCCQGLTEMSETSTAVVSRSKLGRTTPRPRSSLSPRLCLSASWRFSILKPRCSSRFITLTTGFPVSPNGNEEVSELIKRSSTLRRRRRRRRRRSLVKTPTTSTKRIPQRKRRQKRRKQTSFYPISLQGKCSSVGTKASLQSRQFCSGTASCSTIKSVMQTTVSRLFSARCPLRTSHGSSKREKS
mmetsp:Transcript_4151/g.6454  ORF Transcript_4151/g.6454 Transcript_4151/m.6454 type:complete len:211 (-) Transcript_4151:858-1490(-)